MSIPYFRKKQKYFCKYKALSNDFKNIINSYKQMFLFAFCESHFAKQDISEAKNMIKAGEKKEGLCDRTQGRLL